MDASAGIIMRISQYTRVLMTRQTPMGEKDSFCPRR